MSQENIEIARRAVAMVNTHGFDQVAEALAELYHPNAEARDLQPAPGTPEVMRGREAIVGVWKQWTDALDDWRVEVHEFIDADPWVVCDVHWHAIGKGSEAPIDWRVAEAYEFKDGKVVRSLFGFPNVAAVLEAVGSLSEHDARADS
jgi:ketosteroid isomerase-like protein